MQQNANNQHLRRTPAILAALLLAILVALAPGVALAATGDNDPTFNSGDLGFGVGEGANGAVNALAL